MLADIARAHRAQNGVNQSMKPYVGVGMAQALEIVRNRHAAQDDFIAGHQLVHVRAHAGADVAVVLADGARGAAEVFGVRDFHVVRVRRNEGYGNTIFFKNGSVVRQLRAFGLAVRF